MHILQYSAGIVSRPFWFLEFKKTAKLKAEGLTDAQIKEKAIKENLYGAPTEYRANQIFNAIIRRINSLDETILKIFISSDIATEKAVAIIAAMKTDLLFFEFIHEVYREKLILGDERITDKDLNIFFANKRTQSEVVAKWTDYTVEKLVRCYTTYLYEAGLIDSSNGERIIIRPILDIALENYLKNSRMEQFVYALTGER